MPHQFVLRLICPSHHFKSHHQVLITVKCSASGMCLGHKSSDIHHRNHKCKLMYTTMSNLHKKDGLFIYTCISNTQQKTNKKKCFFFQNTKDNIYFIFVKNYWCILSIYCRVSFKIFFFSIPLFLYCECLYQVLDYLIFHGYPVKKYIWKQFKYFH